MEKPVPNTLSRIKMGVSWGPLIIVWSLCYLVLEALVNFVLDYLMPDQEVDICRNFDVTEYGQDPEAKGNHQFSADGLEQSRSPD